jgi:hypothetical protein
MIGAFKLEFTWRENCKMHMQILLELELDRYDIKNAIGFPKVLCPVFWGVRGRYAMRRKCFSCVAAMKSRKS